MLRKLFSLTLLCVTVSTFAFDGSDLEEGKSYYLYNIYQSKFISSEEKLDNSQPVLCTAGKESVSFAGATFSVVKNDKGFYQLKSGSKFLAYISGDDCGLVSANNDRSYWQFISEEEYAAFKAKKMFTVASLNVDGMPRSITLGGNEIKLNPDAKEEAGAEAIGEKLKNMGWDLVGVSEDFNYHANILAKVEGEYEAMTHRGILSVSNANLLAYMSQSPLFDTDGLGLFYRSTSATPSDEKFVAWTAHNGYTDQGADGLIKKGYRFYVVTLADSTQIDLYILHMDAETNAEDNAARATQIRQLVAAIKASDNKRPIIIMGDTNCRYTRDDLKGLLIDAINADDRFTIRDPWIQYGRDNVYPMYGSGSIMADANGYLKGEVVDKVFYINNVESNIRLVAESYAQDLSFIGEDGEPLADHWPCVVSFSYHEFDPEIDDKPLPEKTQEPVYLRNRATGKYLKAGGWWNTHAVVGNYGLPMYITVNEGKYDILSSLGYISKDSYMDASADEARAIKDWTVYEVDGYYVFSYNDGGQRALSANDPFMFNDNPNHRYVTAAALNKNDKYQQWEMLTKSQIVSEVMTSGEPGNVTFLMAGANFDRTDPSNNKWELSKAGTQVTSAIEGLDNYDNSNFTQRISTSKPSGFLATARNTWTLSQTIDGIPNGTYTIMFQGFYKEEGQSGEHKVVVTAGESSMPLRNVYEPGDGSSSSLYPEGEESKDGMYYPTTSQGVTAYFNKGLYQHELADVVVTDGKLTISISKTADTKSYTTLTHIDNFQLIYRHEHTFAEDTLACDETGHWKVCSEELCEGKGEVQSHSFEKGICSVCGYADMRHLEAYEILLAVKDSALFVMGSVQDSIDIAKKGDFAEVAERYQAVLDSLKGEIDSVLVKAEQEIAEATLFDNYMSYSEQIKALADEAQKLPAIMNEEIAILAEELSVNQVNSGLQTGKVSVFTLDGVRVESVTKKGIYIINGKTTFIK